MMRVRFFVNADDPRPINWPVKHPFWVSGYCADGSHAIVVSYADNYEYIYSNWPDAENIESESTNGYAFTERFPKPTWFHEVKE